MKYGMWNGVVACTVTAVAMGFLATASAEQATAKVRAISGGSAQCTQDGSMWKALPSGAVLSQGTTVKTDGGGTADIYLGKNGPWASLSPDTTLGFSTLMCDAGAGETVTATELNLTSGNALFIVRKLSAGSRFSIKTANATCNVLGTKVSAAARGQFAVKDGSAEVFYTAPGATAPTKFNVPPGYTFEPSVNGGKGGVIGTPAELAAEMDRDISRLMAGVAASDGTTWAPTPSWLALEQSSFQSSISGNANNEFQMPPVASPTTAITPEYGYGE